MTFARLVAVVVGTVALVVAGTVSHSGTSSRVTGASPVRTEFGGVSAQTATAAGTSDAGVAWFTLGPGGLVRQVSTHR